MATSAVSGLPTRRIGGGSRPAAFAITDMGRQGYPLHWSTRLLRGQQRRRPLRCIKHAVIRRRELPAIDVGAGRWKERIDLRLITNSNLVGCMTGRPAGFAPLRMRLA